MRVDEMIPGRFYSFTQEDQFYIKFKKIDIKFIYHYTYQVEYIKNTYRYVEKNDIFTFISWTQNYIIKEIDISEIVEYLPDTNVDKKHYLRSKKINNLLKI